MENYPECFENADKDATLKAFCSYPKTMKQGGHNMLQELVTERKDYIASVGQKHYSHGELSLYHQDEELLDNDLVYKLAAPSRIEDTSG